MDADERIIEDLDNNLPIEAVDLAQEILFLIFGIIGTVADALLIYTICYYSKLHSTANICLVNWAIADIGAAFSSIGYFEIFSALFNIPEHVLMFYYNVEATLSITSLLFIILFTTDWCISAYLPRFEEKFKEYSMFVVAGVWILTAVYLIASSATIVITEHIYIFFLVLFGAFLAFVGALHCFRFVSKIRSGFEYHPAALLMISTAYIACWFLCWLNLALLFAADFYVPALIWITDTPAFLHPTINFALLLYLDEGFRTCFFQVVKSFTCCGLITRPQRRDENGIYSS